MEILENIINAPVTGWIEYPSMTVNGQLFAAGTMPITASTNPSKGTVLNDVAYYMQIGKLLLISWQFSQSTGGSAGSGTYSFSIPTGYTINTTVIPTSSGPLGYPFFAGSGELNIRFVVGTLFVIQPANSTSFGIYPNTSFNVPLGSSQYPLSNSNYVIGMEAILPIN